MLRNKGGTPSGDTTSAAMDMEVASLLKKVNPANLQKQRQ
jgi:hypothetical protein